MIAHVKGSDTSKAAAESMEDSAPSIRTRVLRHIFAAGKAGATDDEIEAALGLRHQTASARRRELVIGKFIADSGRRAMTRSGRKATLWVAMIFVEPEQQVLTFSEGP